MSTLRITLFGPLEVECGGQVLPRFPSRKVRDLLVYLVLNRRVAHSREHLAGLFWSDSDEEHARHSLNTALWRLHGVLASVAGNRGRAQLRVTPQEIGFNPAADFWLDVAEFESRCALADRTDNPAQRAALYEQAITFYSGDLLIDCYEEWCVLERERLHCMYLKALTRLMDYRTASHAYELAIDCARRILASDSLREEVHRDLIELYLAAGQPSTALRQYRTCEDILQRELAVAPMPETEALLTRILQASRAGGTMEHRADILGGGARSFLDDLVHELADARVLLRELAAACDQAQARLLHAAEAYPALIPNSAELTRVGPSANVVS